MWYGAAGCLRVVGGEFFRGVEVGGWRSNAAGSIFVSSFPQGLGCGGGCEFLV